MPKSVWALGFVSLFMDTSSELVHSLLPVFLVSVLGASLTSVGLLEGLAESTALIVKFFSGTISDWFGRRKPLVLFGYSISTFTKPFFAIATTVPMVYGARLVDRLGKGVRGAPRDALIADVTPAHLMGRAYGLRQSLDSVGAVLGPLLAILLMSLTKDNIRQVYWFAFIPGLFAVATILFGVKEPAPESVYSSSNKKKINYEELKKLPSIFWFAVVVGGLFQLARFSEAFMVLRVKDAGLSLTFVPIVFVIMNVVYALTAYPVGVLSDKWPRGRFLLASLILLGISDLILAYAANTSVAFVGVVFWGLHLGFSQGVLSSLIADTCPKELRGTGFGFFNLISAFALLSASIVAGWLWQFHGERATFVAGAVLVLVSLLVIWFKGQKFILKESN